MPITNPQAIAFCDQRIRVLANSLARFHYLMEVALDEWTLRRLGNLIPPDGGVVRDGASPNDDSGTGGDGRPVITGEMVNLFVQWMQQFAMRKDEYLRIILAIAPNPKPD